MAIFFVSDLSTYLVLFLLMILLTTVSRIPLSAVFSRMKRYAMLPTTAFLLSVCFHSGTDVIADMGVFKITASGLYSGTLFALRILLLLFASYLLMKSTSLEEMTRGLAQVLYPLGLLGISRHRVATVLSLAWEALPAAWGATRNAMATAEFTKVHTLRNLIPLLSNLIATLYLRAGQTAVDKEKDVSQTRQDPMKAA